MARPHGSTHLFNSHVTVAVDSKHSLQSSKVPKLSFKSITIGFTNSTISMAKAVITMKQRRKDHKRVRKTDAILTCPNDPKVKVAPLRAFQSQPIEDAKVKRPKLGGRWKGSKTLVFSR